MARSWVTTVTATVASMTTLESADGPQVRGGGPAEGADGDHDHHRHQRGHRDLATQSPRNTTINSRKTPAMKVDSRPRPPDFTLITDWPIIAQPAMPPMKPVAKLATPWPTHSRFLSLWRIGQIVDDGAVIRDSSSPTTATVSG
jgi:hypothetical protein